MQRRYRLRRSTDFELLRRSGLQFRHPLAILVVRANREQISRFGFMVSKRLGKATARNRVKRRLREVVRSRIDMIQPGWDVLIIARYAITKAEYAELDDAVSELLRRADLLQAQDNSLESN